MTITERNIGRPHDGIISDGNISNRSFQVSRARPVPRAGLHPDQPLCITGKKTRFCSIENSVLLFLDPAQFLYTHDSRVSTTIQRHPGVTERIRIRGGIKLPTFPDAGVEDEDRVAIRSLPGAEVPADGLLAGVALLCKRMLFGENKDGNHHHQQIRRGKQPYTILYGSACSCLSASYRDLDVHIGGWKTLMVIADHKFNLSGKAGFNIAFQLDDLDKVDGLLIISDVMLPAHPHISVPVCHSLSPSRPTS